MYAVIRTGGKQYRVTPGDVIRVERLDAEPGSAIEFGEVLMVGGDEGASIGTPLVDGGSVTATVRGHVRGPKITIVKFRRRKHHLKRQGHRQDLTEIEITAVNGQGGSAKAAPKKAAKPAAAADAPAPKFLDAPSGEADDLKKISGVGPVLEQKLNGLGIYHYHQVAALTAEQIEQIDTHLNFKGRIERDDWVGQAKRLAASETD